MRKQKMLLLAHARSRVGDRVVLSSLNNKICERRESNPHAFRHWNLNPARLPIPPLSQEDVLSVMYYGIILLMTTHWTPIPDSQYFECSSEEKNEEKK